MAEGNGAGDALTFLKETAARRAPGKRRIKLANVPAPGVGGTDPTDEEAAIYAQFFGADSDEDEDDEDFRGGDRSDASEDSEEGEGSDDGGSEGDEHSEGGAGDDEQAGRGGDADTRASEELESAHAAATSQSSSAPLRMICNLCLNQRKFDTEEEREVVQCDKCGICVHEKCYGYFEPHTTNGSPIPWEQEGKPGGASPSGSSSSTEPWFCDVCLSLERSPPRCELCPNTGGVFKRMNGGGWVHLLCALYLQQKGVSFANIFCLNDVSFEDLDYSMFGAKTCALCSDRLAARTGICIECEAGFCRTFFHVTCAHKQGLLLDQSDVQSHLGFFAYCNKHSDPDASRFRRALHNESVRYCANFSATRSELTEREKSKLYARHNAYGKPRGANVAFKLEEKRARPVYSHAQLLEQMTYKAELQADVGRDQWADALFTPPVLGYVPPAFAPEFFLYYKEREGKLIREAEQKLVEAESELEKMRKLDDPLKQKHEEAQHAHQAALEDDQSATSSYTALADLVRSLGGKAAALKPRSPKTPPVSPRGRRKAAGLNSSTTSSASPTTAKRRRVTGAVGAAQPIVEYECATCESRDNQHLLAHCHTCDKHYHIGCLEPPLNKLPAASTRYQWQCSTCCCGSSDASVDGDMDSKPPDVDAPRQLRHRQLTEKYRGRHSAPAASGRAARGRKLGSGRSRGRPPKKSPAVVEDKPDKREDFSHSLDCKVSPASKSDDVRDAEQQDCQDLKPVLEPTIDHQHSLDSGRSSSASTADGLLLPVTLSKSAPQPAADGSKVGNGPVFVNLSTSLPDTNDRCTQMVNGNATIGSLSSSPGSADSSAKRRTYERAVYSPTALEAAVEAVMNSGQSIKGSAARYKVPRTTVGRRVRLLKDKCDGANVPQHEPNAQQRRESGEGKSLHGEEEDGLLEVDVPRDYREKTPVIRVEDLDLDGD